MLSAHHSHQHYHSVSSVKLGKVFRLRTDEEAYEFQEQMIKTATQVQNL
jgi:phosphoribosylformylglycinamidine (FGAM) synthase PurS component